MTGSHRRDRRSKQDRKWNQRWTERLRTQTPSRKRAISITLHFPVLQFSSILHFLLFLRIFVNAEISEKVEIQENLIFHFERNLENGNLEFIRNQKTRRHKKFEKLTNSWFDKINLLDISTEFVVRATLEISKQLKLSEWMKIKQSRTGSKAQNCWKQGC